MKLFDILKKYGLTTILAGATLDGYRRTLLDRQQSLAEESLSNQQLHNVRKDF
jgi:hypothetical protein